MLTVLWMIETATIAVRPVTAFLLRTTQPCSPMPLCTSSRYHHVCSSKESCGSPVPTPCRIMIWIIGSTWPSGGCCLPIDSCSWPWRCHASRGGQLKGYERLLIGWCYMFCEHWNSAVNQEEPVRLCVTPDNVFRQFSELPFKNMLNCEVIYSWLYFHLTFWRPECWVLGWSSTISWVCFPSLRSLAELSY